MFFGVYFRVSRLKEQCDRVHVRKLMMKYGLKNVEVPQGADAEVKTEETIFFTFLNYHRSGADPAFLERGFISIKVGGGSLC